MLRITRACLHSTAARDVHHWWQSAHRSHPLHCLPARRDGLHRLTQLIFSKAQPKRLGSQILSGPMLAGLTEAYVNAINNGCGRAYSFRDGRAGWLGCSGGVVD